MDGEAAQARVLGVIARPLGVKLAQVAGLTATAYLAGQTASSSYTLLPSILSSPPSLLVRQWRLACRQARKSGPPVVLLATFVFTWLASREPSRQTTTFKAYAAAALLLPMCIPYSRLCVTPTENALLARAELVERGEQGGVFAVDDEKLSTRKTQMSSFPEFARAMWNDKELGKGNPNHMSIHQLVDRWGWLNMGRAALMLSSALCAGWGMASEDMSFFELF